MAVEPGDPHEDEIEVSRILANLASKFAGTLEPFDLIRQSISSFEALGYLATAPILHTSFLSILITKLTR